MLAQRLDGITLEIIGQRILEIVSTMEVYCSSYEQPTRRSCAGRNDGSATFLGQDGRVVMGSVSPKHLVAYYYAVQGVLARHPWERMQPKAIRS